MRDISGLQDRWLIGAAVLALVIPLAFAPAANAAVDCAKSPTFLRQMPGGQELVFHPECEPPAVLSKSGTKAPVMAPVSAPPEKPVPVAGVGAGITPQNFDAAASEAQAAPTSKRRSGPQSADRVRVQGYTRVRRQH